MLTGEVREDQAKRNRNVRNPDALQTAIAWFRGAGHDRGERAT